jgi:hypothetical protein
VAAAVHPVASGGISLTGILTSGSTEEASCGLPYQPPVDDPMAELVSEVWRRRRVRLLGRKAFVARSRRNGGSKGYHQFLKDRLTNHLHPLITHLKL